MKKKSVKKDTSKKVQSVSDEELFSSAYIPSENVMKQRETKDQRKKQEQPTTQKTFRQLFQRPPEHSDEEGEDGDEWELSHDVTEPPPKFWVKEMEHSHDIDRSIFLHRTTGHHVSATEHRYDPKVAELDIEDEPAMLETRKRGSRPSGDKNEDAFRFDSGYQLGHLPRDETADEMRLYINNQIQEQNRRYQEWKQFQREDETFLMERTNPDRDKAVRSLFNFGSKEQTEEGNEDEKKSQHGYSRKERKAMEESELERQWWGIGGHKHTLPHQSVHGGVKKDDLELDLPLNTFWHKSSISPANWQFLKQNFRKAMQPNSSGWNELAFRSEFERNSIKHWPETLKHWFLRSDEELLNSHDFRCKVMDHTATEEFWRLGEMRWNRKYWLPYIRVATWVVIPIVAVYGYLLSRPMNPWYSQDRWEQYKYEFERWKYMVKHPETADDSYTFCMGQKHPMWQTQTYTSFLQPPPLESLENMQKNSLNYQLQQMAKGNKSGIDQPLDVAE